MVEGSSPSSRAKKSFTMKKILHSLAEVREELMEKVSWPTWAQLQESAIVVSVATLIIAGVVLVFDLASKGLMDLFYGLL